MQVVEKIGIVLATYNPNLEYFEKQIKSIKNQTWKNWICHIVDDCSLTKYQVGIKKVIAYDPRFICHFHSDNLNHYHNFERGLQYCLEDQTITAIALADQDDIWHSEKLTILLDKLRLNSAVLVHSDLELINSSDETIHPSAWKFESRKPEKLSLELLLLRNVVTGCSLLFCTSLLPDILPFPPQTKIGWYHDWWIALVALHKGKISHIHQPLVRYRIHNTNNVGVVQNSGKLHQELWELFRKKFQITGNGYLVHRDLSQAFYTRFYPQLNQGSYSNPFDDQKLDFGLNIFPLFYQSLRTGYNSEGVAFRVGLLKILFDVQKVYQLLWNR
ncbi:glycosyltransferase [Nodularia harveyana UHCC-0300]|uniref:Glycosyltransferase n=1 Tax=Nodularia harveyana UHCC-0300 TaxID=2974287 RepID=A0ABU5UK76_9CYAN|nr:glycosyltransferase [Nodularia harveyana]MEA5582841.1 glycosyltransferase [Nodularia harveyana UHCC-0300]